MLNLTIILDTYPGKNNKITQDCVLSQSEKTGWENFCTVVDKALRMGGAAKSLATGFQQRYNSLQFVKILICY
jgi:hypothetical protein